MNINEAENKLIIWFSPHALKQKMDRKVTSQTSRMEKMIKDALPDMIKHSEASTKKHNSFFIFSKEINSAIIVEYTLLKNRANVVTILAPGMNFAKEKDVKIIVENVDEVYSADLLKFISEFVVLNESTVLNENKRFNKIEIYSMICTIVEVS